MRFEVSESQRKKIEAFIKKQEKLTKGGGSYTYHFTPTGIGTAVQIENTLNRTILDISEYEHW